MWMIDLEKVRDDGISIERELDNLDFLGEYQEITGFSPLGVSFTLRPLGQNRFQLDGRLEGQAKGICSRCAEDFEFTYKKEFHLSLEPSSDLKEKNSPRGTLLAGLVVVCGIKLCVKFTRVLPFSGSDHFLSWSTKISSRSNPSFLKGGCLYSGGVWD